MSVAFFSRAYCAARTTAARISARGSTGRGALGARVFGALRAVSFEAFPFEVFPFEAFPLTGFSLAAVDRGEAALSFAVVLAVAPDVLFEPAGLFAVLVVRFVAVFPINFYDMHSLLKQQRGDFTSLDSATENLFR